MENNFSFWISFHRCQHWIVWNWFIAKIVLISPKMYVLRLFKTAAIQCFQFWTDVIHQIFCQICRKICHVDGETCFSKKMNVYNGLNMGLLRILRAILNMSCRQHLTKQQLYGHQPPITKTIQVRRTRHVGHSWRSRDELISDVLLWTPSHGQAKVGRPARTYIV